MEIKEGKRKKAEEGKREGRGKRKKRKKNVNIRRKVADKPCFGLNNSQRIFFFFFNPQRKNTRTRTRIFDTFLIYYTCIYLFEIFITCDTHIRTNKFKRISIYNKVCLCACVLVCECV